MNSGKLSALIPLFHMDKKEMNLYEHIVQRHGPRRKSSKPRNIKYNNQKLVLSLFRYAGKISVSEIASQANLSKTTITKIVSDFLEKGLIISAGKGRKHRRRQAKNRNYSSLTAPTSTP